MAGLGLLIGLLIVIILVGAAYYLITGGQGFGNIVSNITNYTKVTTTVQQNQTSNSSGVDSINPTPAENYSTLSQQDVPPSP